MTTRTQILNHAQVTQIAKRMAYQIYEHHFNEKELLIAGIAGQGQEIAALLCEEITAISKLKTVNITVSVNKENPSQETTKLSEAIKLQGKKVMVVDDVLNTGRTLLYALLPFLNAASIQTAVLVDRSHKSFPVKADFIGVSLATTLQEHVAVEIERKKISVFLK